MQHSIALVEPVGLRVVADQLSIRLNLPNGWIEALFIAMTRAES